MAPVVLLNPELGMPRDWDLFAFAGVPLATMGYWSVLRWRNQSSVAGAVVWLSIGLSLVVLVSRAVILAVPDHGVEQIKSYMTLDPARNRNTGFVLAENFEQIGEGAIADSVKRTWRQNRSDEQVLIRARVLMDQGRPRESISLLNRAISMNPVAEHVPINTRRSVRASRRSGSSMPCIRSTIS